MTFSSLPPQMRILEAAAIRVAAESDPHQNPKIHERPSWLGTKAAPLNYSSLQISTLNNPLNKKPDKVEKTKKTRSQCNFQPTTSIDREG